MKAEIGVIWPEAKECQLPGEAGRGKGWVLPWSRQKEPALLTPWFEPSGTHFRLMTPRTV